MKELLSGLNPAQHEAATYLGGPLMIIAGAGSGKTRVITHRIAFLSREVGIPLGDILAVTFTNKAAREMRERVLKLLARDDSPAIPISTFHSRCSIILRREAEVAGLDRNFLILDDKDQLQAVKQAMKKLDVSEKRTKPSQIHDFIQLAKMRLLTPKETEAEFGGDEIPYPALYAEYEAILSRNKSIDIEDLIFRTVRLFQDNESVRASWARRFQYLLVDEYQDTNHGQFLLTKMLAQDHRSIAVVGDEDQAIYSWRGADITNLLDFSKSFPETKIVRLEQNYRSTGLILKAAERVIARNTQRLGKKLFTDRGEGLPLEYRRGEDDRHEGMIVGAEIERLLSDEEIPPSEIAVFYRSHRLSRPVEDALRTARIPYRIVGGIKFYDRAEIKDLIAFMRISANPADDLAFERVANVPKRGVGDKAMETITLVASEERMTKIEAAWKCVQDDMIGGRARSGLFAFLNFADSWAKDGPTMKASAMLDRILEDTQYLTEGVGDPKSLDGAAKLENITEFRRVAKEFDDKGDGEGAGDFLRTLSLDNTMDPEEAAKSVSLLSIHNAKGLEFRAVFLVGLDEGVFPNSRAMGEFSETGLEEERRLFYVALTRAKERLHLSRAARRLSFSGGYEQSIPSRFLSELPADVFMPTSRAALRRELPFTWEADGDEAPSGPRLFASRTASSAPISAGVEFHRGMRINHRYMGDGQIFNVSGRPGSQKIHVVFDSGREQSFIARQAPITIIGES